MSAADVARSRRFDSELAEVLGDAPPAALAERIVDAIAELPPSRRGVAGWRVAAAVLFGTGIVTLVALSVAGGRAPDAVAGQDPQQRAPIELRTEDMMEEGVIGPDAGDALLRIRSIARDTRTSVVVTADLEVASEVAVDGLGAREAIERIAKEVGASVREERGVLVVGGVGESLPRGARLTLKAGPCSVRELVKQVHARTGVDVVVADGVEATVQCDVVDVPWYAFVQQLALRAGGEVVGCGGALAIRARRPGERLPRVTVAVSTSGVSAAFDAVAHAGPANVVIGRGVVGRVAVEAFRAEQRALLRAIAGAVGAAATRESGGVFVVVAAPARAGTVTLAAERMTARELFAVCAPEVELPGEGEGLRSNASLFVTDARRVDVASAIAAAVGHEVTLRAGRDGYEWR